MMLFDSRSRVLILSALLLPACQTIDSGSGPERMDSFALHVEALAEPQESAASADSVRSVAPLAPLDSVPLRQEDCATLFATTASHEGHHGQAGDWRIFTLLPLYADFDSDVEIIFGDADPVELQLEFEGKFGLALGCEYLLHENVAVRLAVDYRVLEPGNPRNGDGSLSDFFLFEEVDYFEYTLGVRWWAEAFAFGPGRRMRPFLDAKLGYVPSIEAVTTVAFGSEFFEDQTFTFKGDPYFNYGVSAGLTYEWSRKLHLSTGLLFEEPLSKTSDGEVFYPLIPLPDFAVPFSYSLEPVGLLFFVGLSWGF